MSTHARTTRSGTGRKAAAAICLATAIGLSGTAANAAAPTPSAGSINDLRSSLLAAFTEATRTALEVDPTLASQLPTLTDFRAVVAEIGGKETATWYSGQRRAAVKALPGKLVSARKAVAAQRRSMTSSGWSSGPARGLPAPRTIPTGSKVVLGTPLTASKAKFCEKPVPASAIFGLKVSSNALDILIESLTPGGPFTAPAVLAFAIAKGVIELVITTNEYANDEADCTDDTLLAVGKATDANVVKSYALDLSIGKGVNDIIDLLGKLQPTMTTIVNNTTPTPDAPDTVVVPDNLDAILKALADTRAALQRTVAADSQVLSNRMAVLQSSLETIKAGLATRTTTVADTTALQLALEQALSAPTGTTALATFVLPASAGGNLDSTPLGIRSVATSTVQKAKDAGLVFDATAAQAALDAADAALAAKDYRAAFRSYRSAYLEVAN
jgi:hypothetical protein